jgi:hypothetical protein
VPVESAPFLAPPSGSYALVNAIYYFYYAPYRKG